MESYKKCNNNPFFLKFCFNHKENNNAGGGGGGGGESPRDM